MGGAGFRGLFHPLPAGLSLSLCVSLPPPLSHARLRGRPAAVSQQEAEERGARGAQPAAALHSAVRERVRPLQGLCSGRRLRPVQVRAPHPGEEPEPRPGPFPLRERRCRPARRAPWPGVPAARRSPHEAGCCPAQPPAAARRPSRGAGQNWPLRVLPRSPAPLPSFPGTCGPVALQPACQQARMQPFGQKPGWLLMPALTREGENGSRRGPSLRQLCFSASLPDGFMPLLAGNPVGCCTALAFASLELIIAVV